MELKYTLPERINRAHELKAAGYNCSQCVMMAFDDIHKIDDDRVAALSVALGGGVAGQQLTCGTVTAISMLRGSVTYNAPADKPRIYSEVRGMCDDFKALNGSLICAELKSAGRRPCIGLIDDAITLLHNNLAAI